jgi:hypothetical protein
MTTSVALLHLSDIHLKSELDPVLERLKQIADAIGPELKPMSACIIVLSGDIAFSGRDEEYVAADRLVSELTDQLRSRFSGEVHLVLCPGNHDCDFSAMLPGRDKILEGLRQRRKPVSKEMATACAEVQANFFGFLRAKAAPGLNESNDLVWHYQIPVDSKTIRILCCNTAWVSQLKEIPSTLYFPIDYVKGTKDRADVAITMMHHPYGWLAPENARALRGRIEEVSDIVLTGHEHHMGARAVKAAAGETNFYIEGGVLQDSEDSEVSTFNLLLLDLDSQKQKLSRLRTRFSYCLCFRHSITINKSILLTAHTRIFMNFLSNATWLEIRRLQVMISSYRT